MNTKATHALTRALEIVGGQSALARELTLLTGKTIRQPNIWSWLHRTKQVPPEVAPYIEVATAKKGDMVPRTELCPDFPWDVQPVAETATHSPHP